MARTKRILLNDAWLEKVFSPYITVIDGVSYFEYKPWMIEAFDNNSVSYKIVYK